MAQEHGMERAIDRLVERSVTRAVPAGHSTSPALPDKTGLDRGSIPITLATPIVMAEPMSFYLSVSW